MYINGCVYVYVCVCVSIINTFVLFHSLSYLLLTETPWTTACKASLSFTIYLSLLKLTSIESLMPSNHLMKEMGILDHLTCLLRNLCAGQKETVKTGHGTKD